MTQQPTPQKSAFCHGVEAAHIANLPLRSFHRYVKNGLIPSFKIGRHRLYKPEEVIAAIEQRRTATVAEVLK